MLRCRARRTMSARAVWLSSTSAKTARQKESRSLKLVIARLGLFAGASCAARAQRVFSGGIEETSFSAVAAALRENVRNPEPPPQRLRVCYLDGSFDEFCK